ncbi:DUF305 domain-containing protein [Limnobacter sp. UBA3510]|uniref:DUF305 domain-containing protein n=1 Tax=Limnobacter sp. UBA3510 TaxID=1946759 RepID=UPI000C4AE3C2|nr:DUF305 domain-containing protein [Limnobacter sp. UBA3510]MAZ08729.1 hypothetical protein [Sutterellaceae bacterium]|tara:strand:- start:3418 stop:4083 length:666 start_codon:yes stop_codon:yes gene_type:complete
MQHPKSQQSPYPGKRALIFVILALCALVAGFFVFQQSTQDKKPAIDPIDSGFARSMLLHHAQAIQMSMMMRDAASPEIQALAQSIIMKQTREMGVMEGWLTAWNEPVMLAGPPMAWVENATNVRHLDDQLYQAQCKADGGAMAGVATPEQLEELKNATGTEKEIIFLELMLAHHRAAIPMAWFANRNGEASLVKALASAMIREQGMEIGWIQLKLQQLKKS